MINKINLDLNKKNMMEAFKWSAGPSAMSGAVITAGMMAGSGLTMVAVFAGAAVVSAAVIGTTQKYNTPVTSTVSSLVGTTAGIALALTVGTAGQNGRTSEGFPQTRTVQAIEKKQDRIAQALPYKVKKHQLS